MKNSVFQIFFLPILLLTGFLMNSCDNQSSKVKSLKEENRQLKRERAQTEENLYELSKTINFIQSNLDTIKQQEQIISTIANSDIENQPSAKEQISNDITSIYNKLIANRRQLSKLQQSLNKDASQNKDLKAIIDRLNEQMDEKIIQIENLRSQLEQMQGKITNLEGLVDTLNSLRKQQQAIIAYQQKTMNTVYYAYGTSKELKQNNVITKEGGILGIGKARKLKDNLNKDYFTEAQKFELKNITLNARKARIVTPHPEGSYKLHGDKPVDSIEIIDPTRFWSNTQYLVIEIKQ
ncbi:chromosome segregation protein SMC [Salinivirga cyanobacteriivorans]|uniref:Chromosome segregation protein SMC n=1 Tax=Salinivirga cyanobacteriivorans TaxID=1307839 RepID=A0A0S2HVI1_9BACT|nr:hypothetical protein [Salinivirga cyanobacteriivorans]ALO14026.1 chromosome segregation protein SMC [Salinivirga cyanobacteriivorans]